MANLTLGNHNFATTAERDALAALRRRYAHLGLKHRSDFLLCYGDYRTADDLFQDLPRRVERALTAAADLAANDIAAQRVYHLDLTTIRARLIERVEEIAGRFQQIKDSYFAIVGSAAEQDAQRGEARENRGRLAGGGFGVEGAAQGIAIAAVANAAIGITHGLANLTAKAASKIGESRKKRALLEDPTTKRVAADFIQGVVMQGHLVVADAVNSTSPSPVFEIVSEEAQRKSAGLVENVTAGRVPDEDVSSVLIEAIQLDPFTPMPWFLWVDRFCDADQAVSKSAELLGMGPELETYKDRKLSERQAQLAWATPEECHSSAAILEQFASKVGVDFQVRRNEIEQKAKFLDEQRRTVNGVTYGTLNEAKLAQAAFAEQISLKEEEKKKALHIEASSFKGVVFDTPRDAIAARRRYASRQNKMVFITVAVVVTGLIVLGQFLPQHRTPIESTSEATESPNPTAEDPSEAPALSVASDEASNEAVEPPASTYGTDEATPLDASSSAANLSRENASSLTSVTAKPPIAVADWNDIVKNAKIDDRSGIELATAIIDDATSEINNGNREDGLRKSVIGLVLSEYFSDRMLDPKSSDWVRNRRSLARAKVAISGEGYTKIMLAASRSNLDSSIKSRIQK